MPFVPRAIVLLALCAGGLSAEPGHAQAPAFPVKPIRFVVPFPPGGSNDIIARALGPRLAEALGQPVVIDNRPGAGGMIGADNVAKSPADGHVILMISSSFATNVAAARKLAFKGADDFAGVAQVGAGAFALFIHPSLPAKHVQEFVALAKRRPGEINYSSSGQGGINHFATELFQKAAGIRVVHVPYKGIAPAITDLIGGHVQMLITTLLALPHVQTGRLRALAVTGEKRSQFAPELPTIRESGVDYDIGVWFGVLAPAGTPAATVQRLNAEINKALAGNDVKERLAGEGSVPTPGSADTFHSTLRSEVARFARTAKEAGIVID